MRLLFITTLNFATNPRLVKEVRLALQQGYEVEVVCFEFNNWSYEFNQQIKKEFRGAKLHIIRAGRKPFLPWATSVFLERLFRTFSGRYPKGQTAEKKIPSWKLSQAVSRRTILLSRKIKSIKGNFDLVIGHNPGALYATYFAGKRFDCMTGFDVEDYHPGEGDDKHLQLLTKNLMNSFLPKMDYVTFAAPLMKTKTISDIGYEGQNWTEVYNFFPKEEFVTPDTTMHKKLRIVWFSQNVNYKRGLEQIIPALEPIKDKIELTLIGNRKQEFFDEFLSKYSFVKYMPFLDQETLHKELRNFDVGLAIEPAKDMNNNMALSNKLFAYYQSGLFILATDTPAQEDFFQIYPRHGIAVPLQSENATAAVEQLLSLTKKIKAEKQKRFLMSQSENWKKESKKLMEVWNSRRVAKGYRSGR